jgi:hypothetical protein
MTPTVAGPKFKDLSNSRRQFGKSYPFVVISSKPFLGNTLQRDYWGLGMQ